MSMHCVEVHLSNHAVNVCLSLSKCSHRDEYHTQWTPNLQNELKKDGAKLLLSNKSSAGWF